MLKNVFAYKSDYNELRYVKNFSAGIEKLLLENINSPKCHNWLLNIIIAFSKSKT